MNNQQIINRLLEELQKIQQKAYYYGSIGENSASAVDKIDSMCLEALRKYEGYYVKGI